MDVNLRDVSMVTHPACEGTTVAVRGDISESIEMRWYTDEPVAVPLEPRLDYERCRVDELELERQRARVRLARLLY